MPRLGVFSGAEVCRILEAEGFRNVRQRGSHIMMQRQAGAGTTTVPVPNHRVIYFSVTLKLEHVSLPAPHVLDGDLVSRVLDRFLRKQALE